MQPLKDTATNVLHDLLAAQPQTPAKMAFAWRIAAGASLARATEIAWTGDGRLVVRAKDPAWRREVTRATPLIASRLERLLGPGVVKYIRVED